MTAVLNIFLILFLIVMGVIPILYMSLSIPVIIVWKIYRKIRFGYTLNQ